MSNVVSTIFKKTTTGHYTIFRSNPGFNLSAKLLRMDQSTFDRKFIVACHARITHHVRNSGTGTVNFKTRNFHYPSKEKKKTSLKISMVRLELLPLRITELASHRFPSSGLFT
jgi:hypothetical protein